MTGQEAIKQMLAHVEAKLEAEDDFDFCSHCAYDTMLGYKSMRDFLIELAEAERVLADRELNGYGDAQ